MGLIDSVFNLFFPPRCASCKQEGDFLCKKCVQRFQLSPLKAKSHCSSGLDFEHLDGVIYGADYSKNPELQAALAQFKYKFTKELVAQFGRLTGNKLNELGMLKDRQAVLVPVPLHKKRLDYRGFNQAELIAREAMKYCGRAGIQHLLVRVRNTSQQAKLGRSERRTNLEGAFELAGNPPQISGKICFLVDDVCTTGSTLDNCAQVLKRNGVSKVYGLVVARAFK